MDYRLLGPLEVLRDGRALPLGGAKQRGLLALLLLHANEVVSRDRLLEELWGDRPPGAADHSLDVQLSRLRKAFEPDEPLLRRSGGYLLELEPDDLDTRRFERLLEDGRRANAGGEPREALAALEQALALWRGGALTDFAYEAFARTEVERLEELHLVATEERIAAELALGRHDTLVPELEALVARHPLRERPRGQLMLALYRSGRQAEALAVYADTRRRLVEELGLEPSPALRELEQAILRHDPALALPAAASRARRRRALVGALALAAAGAPAALAVLLTHGGAGTAQGKAQALARADTNVFLDAASGKLLRQAAIPRTVFVRYGAGSLWSVSTDGELVRLDPATGKTLATVGLGIAPSGMAVGKRSVWLTDTDTPTLVRVDTTVNQIVDRIALPQKGVVTTRTSGVAVGAGSVWVGHGQFNPGAWVERLDPATGRVRGRFSVLGGGADSLAFGDGAVWVASTGPGELRKIDPRTNDLTLAERLHGQMCCVAAGGGFVWAAINPDATVWKVTQQGSPLRSFKLRAPIENLTYADGALWAADGNAGTVVRIDPTTNAMRTYTVGHHVADVDVRNGVVAVGLRPSARDAGQGHGTRYGAGRPVTTARTELAAVRTRRTARDITAGLKGRIVRVALKSDTLFWSGTPTDPALSTPWDAPQEQLHYATCAKLLNYPDTEGEAGRKVVREVAAAFPKVSNAGRTYTFRIRRGYRFSPPSNKPVTAESFRRQIERLLSPKLFPGSSIGPDVIVGANAYHSGKTAQIAGISARGKTLVIRLVKPTPSVPWVLADVPYCAVPASTPVVPGGVQTPIPSAGPYYLAARTDSTAVLKRNPNYRGPRRPRLDAIVYELSVPPGTAAARVAKGALDYVAEYDPALAPGSAAVRAAGRRYRRTPEGRRSFSPSTPADRSSRASACGEPSSTRSTGRRLPRPKVIPARFRRRGCYRREWSASVPTRRTRCAAICAPRGDWRVATRFTPFSRRSSRPIHIPSPS